MGAQMDASTFAPYTTWALDMLCAALRRVWDTALSFAPSKMSLLEWTECCIKMTTCKQYLLYLLYSLTCRSMLFSEQKIHVCYHFVLTRNDVIQVPTCRIDYFHKRCSYANNKQTKILHMTRWRRVSDKLGGSVGVITDFTSMVLYSQLQYSCHIQLFNISKTKPRSFSNINV